LEARDENSKVIAAVVFDHENKALDSRIDREQARLDYAFAAGIGEAPHDGPHRRVTRDAKEHLLLEPTPRRLPTPRGQRQAERK
jgi:hypothetical protein